MKLLSTSYDVGGLVDVSVSGLRCHNVTDWVEAGRKHLMRFFFIPSEIKTFPPYTSPQPELVCHSHMIS